MNKRDYELEDLTDEELEELEEENPELAEEARMRREAAEMDRFNQENFPEL